MRRCQLAATPAEEVIPAGNAVGELVSSVSGPWSMEKAATACAAVSLTYRSRPSALTTASVAPTPPVLLTVVLPTRLSEPAGADRVLRDRSRSGVDRVQVPAVRSDREPAGRVVGRRERLLGPKPSGRRCLLTNPACDLAPGECRIAIEQVGVLRLKQLHLTPVERNTAGLRFGRSPGPSLATVLDLEPAPLPCHSRQRRVLESQRQRFERDGEELAPTPVADRVDRSQDRRLARAVGAGEDRRLVELEIERVVVLSKQSRYLLAVYGLLGSLRRS
jgi:hypothetical protein